MKVKIGKIIEIEGFNIIVEVTEKNISEKINFKIGTSIIPLMINKLVSISLLNGNELIGKIDKIYENNHTYNQDYLKQQKSKICISCTLIGMYNHYLKSFDEGINNFPLINSEVYSVPSDLKKVIMNIEAEYKLKIGTSYVDSEVEIFADPDILFGKHLGIFGNTGTGKSCTVASIIQGLKKRLYDKKDNMVKVNPKIIIFDSNNEYFRAFNNAGLNCKKIEKKELNLPHNNLSNNEYCKLLGASQGVQAPTLKKVLKKLKKTKKYYSLSRISEEIESFLQENSKEKEGYKKGQVNSYSYNQWFGWLSTMINRLEHIMENEELSCIIDKDSSSIQDTLETIKNDKENNIFIIDSDFDREELDIIIFLFGKLLYKNCQNENIVLVLEEAHRYINEEEENEFKLGNYYIQKIAREGRKFGISLIISSQRPSEISKSIVSQCNSFIVHKLTNKSDNEFINKILSSKSRAYLNLLPNLERQHALVCGEAFPFIDIVKIEIANPTPKSDDPEMIKKWLFNEE